MKCLFHVPDETDPDFKVCRNCGRERRTETPVERITADCKLGVDRSDSGSNFVINAPVYMEPSSEQRQPIIGFAKRVATFARAIGRFVSDGMRLVTKEQYVARLDVCEPCPHRYEHACKVCTCNLLAKAMMRSEYCPLAKWPDDPKRNVTE